MSQNREVNLLSGESWRMFDEISSRYDLLNRVLSFGQDLKWRKRLADYLPAKKDQYFLDLATGTADVLLSLCEKNQNIRLAYGIDMAGKMLDVGKRKIEKKSLSSKIILVQADALKLPFPAGTFEVATIAFGIRNMPNAIKTLMEMFRVLRRGGRALVLEFSLPTNGTIRLGYLLYLRMLVPAVGFLLSGHYQAYRYLNKTIEKFPYGEQFSHMMRQVGFQNVQANPLMLGVATIYQGDKE